ncbi:MAG: hypothetical protein ABFS17_12995 [Chloroflexota bacterium]
MIRPFELKDLPLLHRYRERGIFLNNPSTLTWGPMMVPVRAVLSPVSNAVGIYTAVSTDETGEDQIIGQVRHFPGREDARFTFLAPALQIDPGGFQVVVEYLVTRLGEHQAQNLIAEVEESSDCFELLRRAGFSIYARQHIWKITSLPREKKRRFNWQAITSLDEINARNLYHAVVPTMVQQVETNPWEELNGWVLYQDGELRAYTYVSSGPRGIWVQPYIDSEIAEFSDELTKLLAHLRPRERRPVYVCLRSYQGGIAPHLEALGGEMSGSQAVMVRRLTAAVKKPEIARLPAINGKAEASTPYNHASDEGMP